MSSCSVGVIMTTSVCPKCGTPYQTPQAVCTKCGKLLIDPSTSTVHIRVDPNLLRLRKTRPATTAQPGNEHAVTLLIRGIGEKLVFEEGTEIILGRTDVNTTSKNRLDLTVYGAHERGVSREHAVLRFKNGKLTLTDLGSINGTLVNQDKLPPNQTRDIKDGDEILFGRVPIKVHFEALPEPKIEDTKKTNDLSTVHITR